MNQLIQPIAGLLIRHGLTVASGVLLARYGIAVDASAMDAIAGTAVLGIGLSIAQKLQAART